MTVKQLMVTWVAVYSAPDDRELQRDRSTPIPSDHHEMELPPVGPQVSVEFDGRQVELTLAELSHGATTIPLLDL